MAILLIVPASLVSCGVTAIDGCAGWKPFRVAEASVGYLAQNDTAALKALIAHNEFGQKRKCWK